MLSSPPQFGVRSAADLQDRPEEHIDNPKDVSLKFTLQFSELT